MLSVVFNDSIYVAQLTCIHNAHFMWHGVTKAKINSSKWSDVSMKAMSAKRVCMTVIRLCWYLMILLHFFGWLFGWNVQRTCRVCACPGTVDKCHWINAACLSIRCRCKCWISGIRTVDDTPTALCINNVECLFYELTYHYWRTRH